MATGTITSLRDRGFGFIARDDTGRYDVATERHDLFFHSSAVAAGGFDQLREGQRVSFDEEPDPRDETRRRAVNVQSVAGGNGG